MTFFWGEIDHVQSDNAAIEVYFGFDEAGLL